MNLKFKPVIHQYNIADDIDVEFTYTYDKQTWRDPEHLEVNLVSVTLCHDFLIEGVDILMQLSSKDEERIRERIAQHVREELL